MNDDALGLIKIVLGFGVVLGLLVHQLLSLRRETRRNEDADRS